MGKGYPKTWGKIILSKLPRLFIVTQESYLLSVLRIRQIGLNCQWMVGGSRVEARGWRRGRFLRALWWWCEQGLYFWFWFWCLFFTFLPLAISEDLAESSSSFLDNESRKTYDNHMICSTNSTSSFDTNFKFTENSGQLQNSKWGE